MLSLEEIQFKMYGELCVQALVMQVFQ